MKTVTLIGASGLIGSHILELLQTDTSVDKILLLTRRAIGIVHPKVQTELIRFDDLDAFKKGISSSDAVFCAIGTTNAKVKGDMAAYRKVDYDIPVNAARLCAETDCPQFLLVSSTGSSSKSANFYAKMKGEVEDAMQLLSINSIHIFRPSLLLGNRKENRVGEKIAQAILPAISFLIPAVYKPIQAAVVAKAMVAAMHNGKTGIHLYHYNDMQALAAQ